MFADLYEHEEKVRLPIFESTPGFQEIIDFNWDTSLPELDAPWPHHMPEQLGLREMVAWISGRSDVTDYLYRLSDLDDYEKTLSDDVTALMDVVMA